MFSTRLFGLLFTAWFGLTQNLPLDGNASNTTSAPISTQNLVTENKAVVPPGSPNITTNKTENVDSTKKTDYPDFGEGSITGVTVLILIVLFVVLCALGAVGFMVYKQRQPYKAVNVNVEEEMKGLAQNIEHFEDYENNKD